MKFDVTFLTLRVFSSTGGIEKVCRILGKSLHELALENNESLCILSSHDHSKDAKGNLYFPEKLFKGFGNIRFSFLISSLWIGLRSKKIIISHVNLLPVAAIIKLLKPGMEIYMLAHGIEVWSIPLGYKRHFLKLCSRILCVSTFTKTEMEKRYPIAEEKYFVLNNCLDPYIPPMIKKDFSNSLRLKYGFSVDDKIMFTLTRMEHSERYKGYDRVIDAMVELKSQYPTLKYLLGGSYAEQEKKYIDEKIKSGGLEEKVVFVGFIPDEKLPEYFAISDLYVMPSFNEGFGIVFIEAMHYGLPVIAGNKDGSVDALLNGKLGTLIDPMDIEALKLAIVNNLNGNKNQKPDQGELMSHFSYDVYKGKIGGILKLTNEDK